MFKYVAQLMHELMHELKVIDTNTYTITSQQVGNLIAKASMINETIYELSEIVNAEIKGREGKIMGLEEKITIIDAELSLESDNRMGDFTLSTEWLLDAVYSAWLDGIIAADTSDTEELMELLENNGFYMRSSVTSIPIKVVNKA